MSSSVIGNRLDGSAAAAEPWRQLVEGFPAAVYTTDAAGRITFLNEAAVELAGHRPELGRDLWCVSLRLHRPDGTPLPHEVIEHEPRVSFFGGPDGLDVVRRLVYELPEWLQPGGAYAQECDPSQIATVLGLLERGGMRELRAHRDPHGVERVVSARKP